jgi:hypothetical protein
MQPQNDLGLPTVIPGLDGGSEETFSDFAQGILNQIPEEDRSIVSKYIKDWDGNVTKQFQKIHEQYKPYKELGPVEDIMNSLQYVQLLNEDPINFIKQVQEAMKEAGIVWEKEDEDKSVLPEYEGLPQSAIEKIRQLEDTLSKVYEKVEVFEGSAKEKEEQAALDSLLSDLHTRHGDFDEDYVLLQIARGSDPDEAVGKFSEFVSKYSSPTKNIPPAPNLLRGTGNVPNGQVDVSKMSKQDKMALAVATLKAHNAARNS